MDKIPKKISEQVKAWELPESQNKKLNKELETYFELREKRIQENKQMEMSVPSYEIKEIE